MAIDHKNLPQRTISIALSYDHDHDSTHTGFLFSLNGKTFFAHLAWHKNLIIQDSASFHGLNYARLEHLDNIDKTYARRGALIAYIQHICKRYQNELPYATLFHGTRFNKNGLLQLAKGESGLTCATFILAVLFSNGIELIDPDSWRSRKSDEVWRDKIIRILNHTKAPDSHICKVRLEKHAIRFRPEEVFCAATIPFHQAKYCFCRVAGSISRRSLRRGTDATSLDLKISDLVKRLHNIPIDAEKHASSSL